MFYLTTHSTHFIYGYMASYIWLRTILIVRKETRCRHIGYSYRLTARVLLYAPSHRQDNTSRGALAGTRNSLDISRQIIININNSTLQKHVIRLSTHTHTHTHTHKHTHIHYTKYVNLLLALCI